MPRPISTSPRDLTSSASGGVWSPSPEARTLLQDEHPQNATLRLRLVRGPLKAHENESILSQYNKLASANIPVRQFLHWVQEGPEGPAWHAILEARDGDIVGHTSLIPLRATERGCTLVAAKSEYSFIREEYRASKIQGFEETGRLKNLIYIDELFRRCRSEGWSPLLISTSSAFHRVFRSIGCYPVNFPLLECLLVLRPHDAALSTPNLRRWQRASLLGAGLAQTLFWAISSAHSGRIRTLPVAQSPMLQRGQALSFFQDQDSLAWRYPGGQYERIAEDGGEAELIVKNGSESQYLRVSQWSLHSESKVTTLIAKLVQMARQQRALGVRWAVYGEDAASAALVKHLRKSGFLCARRVRTVLINTAEQKLLDPKEWNITDAMFSFDH